MAAGDLITLDWQQEYNGLLLGDGTTFELIEGSNWFGWPAVTSSTVNRMGAHGGIPGRHSLPAKTFAATWDIKASDEATFKARRQAFSSAFAVRTEATDEQPFVFRVEDTLYQIKCRPIDQSIPLNNDFARLYTVAAVRFEASWPLVQSLLEKSVTLNIATTTAGLTFPLVFPLVFGAGTGGSASVVNVGTAPSPWRATISGDTPNPKITHVESGKFIEFSGLTVAAGDLLEIDSFNKTVLLNGVSSRRSYMTAASSWFELRSGTNTIQFSSGGATTGQLTFYWRDSYWGA